MRIVTDYNGVHRAKVTPDIVTMNNAHQTHYSDYIEPGVKFVLRGWDPGGGVANHHLQYRDVRVNNVPTNVRGFGETRYNGNSIFVFDLADLCIAHLGHLHHTLTEADLAEIGTIDIVLVPVDGSFTLNQPEMIEVLKQLKAKIAIPMHVFTEETLARFLARAEERGFGVRHAPEPRIIVSRVRPAGNAGNPGAAGAVGSGSLASPNLLKHAILPCSAAIRRISVNCVGGDQSAGRRRQESAVVVWSCHCSGGADRN